MMSGNKRMKIMMKKCKENEIDDEGVKSGDKRVKIIMKKCKRDKMDNKEIKVVIRK
jgi:hypothetical protein